MVIGKKEIVQALWLLAALFGLFASEHGGRLLALAVG